MAGPQGPAYMRKDGYFMKAMKRRLLSLFMAMVMVLSLAPMALATGVSASIEGNATSVKSGETVQFSAQVTGNNTGDRIAYEWGTTGSLSVKSGQGTESVTVEGTGNSEGRGSVTLKVTVTPAATEETPNPTPREVQATAKELTVTAPDPKVTGFTLTSSLTLTYGGASAEGTITGTLSGVGDYNKTVAWSISDGAEFISIDKTETTSETASVKVTARSVTERKTATIAAVPGGDVSKVKTCTVTINPSNSSISITPATTALNRGGNVTLEVKPSNGVTVSSVEWKANPTASITFSDFTPRDPAKQIATVNANAATGKVTITATAVLSDETTKTATCEINVQSQYTAALAPTPNTTSPIYLNGWTVNNSDYYNFSVVAKVNNGDIAANTYTVSYVWTLNGTTVQTSKDQSGERTETCEITPDSDGIKNTATSKNTLTCEATFSISGETQKVTKSWDFYTGYKSATITPSVTVYDSNSGYALSDTPDEGSKSITEQIDSQVWNAFDGTKRNYYYKVSFSYVGSSSSKEGYLEAKRDVSYDVDELEDIIFVPTATLTSSSSTAKATFDFVVTIYPNDSNRKAAEFPGALTFNLKRGDSSSSGDVTFYGEVGEDVSFDAATFEDFWDDKFPGGDLDYVTFSPSGGTLYDGDGKKVTSSKECYVNSRKSNIGLDELYFEPSSTNSKKATTITFSFTAYGENKSGADKEASGRVSIVYMSDSPKDISYTVGSNGTVSLKASDFTAAYKEVISGSVPSTLTIVFQGVPKSGTLTYNDSSKKNAKDVTLTNSNIKKYSFTTKSSGSNQLNDITYSGTSGTDTIEYTAYSGSTPKFKGKVVFNGKAAVPTDVVVYFASAAGQPARFSQNDFVTANSALSKAVKYRFTAPANGTLYLNGATSAAGVDIASALLYSVTYQPKAGYNGSDKSVFMAYDSSNALVASGTVNFTIAGNPSTTPTNPGNSGGVTDVSQFKDVPNTQGNAWYRSNLDALVKKGVISGRPDGTFDPTGTVNYGEALKMVLEACGYSAVAGTGSQWAINYKNLAVSHGWISSDIDLNAAISRNAIADLTGKVLGVSPATSGSPFADSASAYAVALYYTTPQIFKGNPNNGGKPLFKGESSLSRAEVCVVIYQVMDYHTQHTTNAMPDGT